MQNGNLETCLSKVTNVHHHETKEEMSNQYLVINGDLQVTPNHPLLVDGVWIYAGDIKIGAHLFSITGSGVVVKSVEKVYKKVPTYNLETALFTTSRAIASGTYFVQGSMVHTQKSINVIKDIECQMSQQGSQQGT